MSRKETHLPPSLPQSIAHWQTNFTEMKHKVIDYLRKHTPDESHPIVDARHYLILNSNTKNMVENPSLSCMKYKKDNILHTQQEYHHIVKGKELIINDDVELRNQRNDIFKQKYKVSSSNYPTHLFQDDNKPLFPSVCSFRPQEAKESDDGHRLATLKKKLQAYKHSKDELEMDNTLGLQRQRYHSIQVKRKHDEERAVKQRANSTLKRIIGDRDRIKTHYEDQKKNIFFIPVSEYLKEHQQALDTKNQATKPKQEISNHSQKQIKDIEKEEPQSLTKSEPTTPSTSQMAANEDTEVFPRVSIYGIEPTKETHSNIHKRFYGHTKEHKAEVKLLQKERFQKFECSPWENLKDEATIANLEELDP